MSSSVFRACWQTASRILRIRRRATINRIDGAMPSWPPPFFPRQSTDTPADSSDVCALGGCRRGPGSKTGLLLLHSVPPHAFGERQVKSILSRERPDHLLKARNDQGWWFGLCCVRSIFCPSLLTTFCIGPSYTGYMVLPATPQRLGGREADRR